MRDLPVALNFLDKINVSSSMSIFLDSNILRKEDCGDTSNTPSIKKESLPWRINSWLARSPNKTDKASINMDLPDPVSPVKIVMPLENSNCMCSMRAKFFIPIRNSILIPH